MPSRRRTDTPESEPSPEQAERRFTAAEMALRVVLSSLGVRVAKLDEYVELLFQLELALLNLPDKPPDDPSPPPCRRKAKPIPPPRFDSQSVEAFLERIRLGTNPADVAEIKKITHRWARMDKAAAYFAARESAKNNS
jgi:hypothetical protein